MISQDIQHIYKATQDEIAVKLVTISGVFHIALSMVQTNNRQDYLGVVLFHLGKPKNKLIGIEQFLLECLSFGGESHMGEALAHAMYDVLCKLKIQDCVWGVVCNNTSNNAKIIRRFPPPSSRLLRESPECQNSLEPTPPLGNTFKSGRRVLTSGGGQTCTYNQ
ncbi:hypothetical protein FRC08_003052 [Ceratobasidium sp. 394]|nr:hypothetical protein FRC08_003052 [Ceratobasidium sp. 394]